jgi:pimeloyl-ACP methyl ester carboxylesterase
VYLVGHSLGGAIAQAFLALLAVRDPSLMPRLEALVGVGAPKVFNKGSGTWISSLPVPILRIEAQGDFVPWLPPAIGYRHVGERCFLRKVQGQKRKISERLGLLPDHSVLGIYLPRLEAWGCKGDWR